ncbi:hypothetical protein [Hymenobacter norwichensis]|uniref:hypothetical protein n=1 Tax=Hymenobacter norwichensis TaxID=223903 RepID=UPI00146B64C4|nr:hypothetical protein [Hymenobacter norwichensis]
MMLFFRPFPNLKRTNLVPEPSNKPFSLMKHLFNTLSKLAAVAVVGLSISSCNRAEYAMLPKTTPYHATYGNVAKVEPTAPATSDAAVVAEPATPQVEKSVAVEAPAPATTAKVAATPAAPSRTTRAAAQAAQSTAASKPNFTQRLALNKVTKQLNKLTSKAQIKQHSETAKANAISGNLRTGIILLLIGLLVSLFSGISSIFGLIGGIIAIIGVIFIILWLLDEL